MSLQVSENCGNASESIASLNAKEAIIEDRIKSYLFNIVDPAEIWTHTGLTQSDLDKSRFNVDWTASNYLCWEFEITTPENESYIVFYDGYDGLDSDGDEWKIQRGI